MVKWILPFLFLGLSLPSFSQSEIDPVSILVQFKNKQAAESFRERNQILSFEFLNPFFPIVRLEANLSLMQIWQTDTSVLFIQKEHELKLRNRIPNDPKYDTWQWNLPLIGVDSIWNYTTGGINALGDSLVIAMIDGGIDMQHEDLQNNLWHNLAEIPQNGIDDDGNGYVDDVRGWQFDQQNDAHTANSHGSSVAGIMTAESDNSAGIAGINWKTKLMVLSGSEQQIMRESNLLAAYLYILYQKKLYLQSNRQSGANVVVVNLSAGIDYAFASDFPLWCSIYDSLGAYGILSVSSVMNQNEDVEIKGDMPTLCSSPYLITVTESTRFDVLDINAAYGVKSVDMAAPGAVYTCRPNNSYNVFGGTSGAAPHVAGTIALLYSFQDTNWAKLQRTDPAAAALLIKNFLIQTAKPIPYIQDKTVSGGRIDAFKSMKLLQSWFSRSGSDFVLAELFSDQYKIEIATNLYQQELYLDFHLIEGRYLNSIRLQTDAEGRAIYFLSQRFENQQPQLIVLRTAGGRFLNAIKWYP